MLFTENADTLGTEAVKVITTSSNERNGELGRCSDAAVNSTRTNGTSGENFDKIHLQTIMFRRY